MGCLGCGRKWEECKCQKEADALFAEFTRPDNPLDDGVRWQTCSHQFMPYFGPVLKCRFCGASTMVSMDGKSKPIYAPDTYDDSEECPT